MSFRLASIEAAAVVMPPAEPTENGPSMSGALSSSDSLQTVSSASLPQSNLTSTSSASGGALDDRVTYIPNIMYEHFPRQSGDFGTIPKVVVVTNPPRVVDATDYYVEYQHEGHDHLRSCSRKVGRLLKARKAFDSEYEPNGRVSLESSVEILQVAS